MNVPLVWSTAVLELDEARVQLQEDDCLNGREFHRALFQDPTKCASGRPRGDALDGGGHEPR